MNTQDVPDFRELFEEMRDYEGNRLSDDILMPWMSKAMETLDFLSPHKRIRDRPQLPADSGWELADEIEHWYAISRVNDLLLLTFQRPIVRGQWRNVGRHEIGREFRHVRAWIEQNLPTTLSDYLGFFECLGFDSFSRKPFSPFYFEIVEVEEDPEPDFPIEIEEVIWPGLMFGEMLFSRAGVIVRAGANVLNRHMATKSTLFFSYWRLYRPTCDLSEGWGHNSQWRTRYHRNYETETHLHYNIDGITPRLRAEKRYIQCVVEGTLPNGIWYSLYTPPWEKEEKEPSFLEQRIEFLTYRCCIRTPISGDYPWFDRVVEPKKIEA